MHRVVLAMAAVHGFLAVACGAFGAHGLKKRLAETADAATRLDWWKTASHYQLAHAIALLGVALLLRTEVKTSLTIASWSFCVGATIFSGTLYAMTLGAPRFLGAVTPMGGMLLLCGWAALLVFAWRG